MSDLGYDGKVAIVTGAGGGLGRSHALELAKRGARIVVNDLGGSLDGSGGDAGPAAKVAQEINDLGGEAVANTDSVSTPQGGAAVVQTAVDAFGTVDIVINNAGILRDKTFHNLTPELLEPVIAVHLLGAFYVTQPAWLIMREKSYGRIINTSSNSGILGNFGQSNYGAAKMGLVGFTRVLANEGRKYNIKANAIAPVAKTRMTEELLGSFGDKLEAEEITPTVCYLAHEDCPVTGEIYSVAGGTVSRFFIGLTPGWYKNGHSVEDVRDNFEQIRNEEGYIVPAGPQDELAKLLGMLSAE
ncbi:MAG TPA: short-chain dehydrogenase [Acidimicrobiaceae bacterium]|jgi:NAD(P)-dependent dehydrogenase (short-subunit alcohol dehydrogenase family)|nr:short-chain dehydrogenase [Acidimicrobiaceae bacterium]